MIYDEETDWYYLNEAHMKNSKAALENLKKQKPFSKEEMIAQCQRNEELLKTLKG